LQVVLLHDLAITGTNFSRFIFRLTFSTVSVQFRTSVDNHQHSDGLAGQIRRLYSHRPARRVDPGDNHALKANSITITQGPVGFGENEQFSVFVRDPNRNVIELGGREQGAVEGITRYVPCPRGVEPISMPLSQSGASGAGNGGVSADFSYRFLTGSGRAGSARNGGERAGAQPGRVVADAMRARGPG
jgi:hypothetical protein